MTRCRAGDLAVVLPSVTNGAWGDHLEICRQLVGAFVTVKHLRPPENETCTAAIVWRLKRPVTVFVGEIKFEVDGIPDEDLWPIRPDASPQSSDESLGECAHA